MPGLPCRRGQRGVTLAILLGLLSAVLYGATDFVARIAGRNVGPLRTIAYGHILAGCVLGALILRTGLPAAGAIIWTLILLTNVTGIGATLFLYHALSVGRLSVVTPVAATYGGITAILSLASGEALNRAAWLGIAAIAGGGVLIARTPDQLKTGTPRHAGLALAIAAAVLYGISFWIQGAYVVPNVGFLLPTWTYYLAGAASSWSFGLLSRHDMSRPVGRNMAVVAATTMLGCGGTLCLAAGQMVGEAGVVTVLSALASGVTVLLACAFLGEGVTAGGYVGLALVGCGLAALHL